MWDIIIIVLLHGLFTNPLEKQITQLFIIDRRPNKQCINNNNFICLGMPSGHTEVATILCLLLYYSNLIPLYIAIYLIILVGIQRILTMAHTVFQVLVGLILGLIYVYFYRLTSSKEYRIIMSFSFVIILACLYKFLQLFRVT